MNQNYFERLGIGAKFRRALAGMGYVDPTPIQSQAIPPLLEGKDLMGIAQTGTGKTAAFGLPLLDLLDTADAPAQSRRPRSLILAPTRELALQIHEELASLARNTELRLAVIFGGVGQHPQVKALARGVDVLVATPGRLLDLVGQRHLDLSAVQVLVLDEADRLLDMGFIRDVKRIVAMTPGNRQSLLFSATMPKAVTALAREILNSPVRIDVSPKRLTVKKIDQRTVIVPTSDKQRMLEKLLHDDEVSSAIVFTRTKHGADKVARKLGNAGIEAEAIHGNKSQNARQRALQKFKSGDVWVLVATDIAARGIDVEGVTHVINHELPHEPESYVHRIGRTGRAGATGIAWSMVDPSERDRLKAVVKLIGFTPTAVNVELPPLQAPEARSRQSEARHGARDVPASAHNTAPGRRRRRSRNGGRTTGRRRNAAVG